MDWGSVTTLGAAVAGILGTLASQWISGKKEAEKAREERRSRRSDSYAEEIKALYTKMARVCIDYRAVHRIRRGDDNSAVEIFPTDRFRDCLAQVALLGHPGVREAFKRYLALVPEVGLENFQTDDDDWSAVDRAYEELMVAARSHVQDLTTSEPAEFMLGDAKRPQLGPRTEKTALPPPPTGLS